MTQPTPPDAPTYAHDAHCNTTHTPGPDPCPPAADDHVYLSTGCLHGEHGYCIAAKTVGGVTKAPAQCKFCSAPCRCPCHAEPAEATP